MTFTTNAPSRDVSIIARDLNIQGITTDPQYGRTTFSCSERDAGDMVVELRRCGFSVEAGKPRCGIASGAPRSFASASSFIRR